MAMLNNQRVYLTKSHSNPMEITLKFGKEPRLERLAAERSVGATSGVPGRRGTAEGAVEHLRFTMGWW